jgi:hypothetical protein
VGVGEDEPLAGVVDEAGAGPVPLGGGGVDGDDGGLRLGEDLLDVEAVPDTHVPPAGLGGGAAGDLLGRGVVKHQAGGDEGGHDGTHQPADHGRHQPAATIVRRRSRVRRGG